MWLSLAFKIFLIVYLLYIKIFWLFDCSRPDFTVTTYSLSPKGFHPVTANSSITTRLQIWRLQCPSKACLPVIEGHDRICPTKKIRFHGVPVENEMKQNCVHWQWKGNPKILPFLGLQWAVGVWKIWMGDRSRWTSVVIDELTNSQWQGGRLVGSLSRWSQ